MRAGRDESVTPAGPAARAPRPERRSRAARALRSTGPPPPRRPSTDTCTPAAPRAAWPPLASAAWSYRPTAARPTYGSRSTRPRPPPAAAPRSC
eukprot:2020636-Pyramimonas_sp.AAC.1